MSPQEKIYVKEVCSFFYPSNPPYEINDKLADLAGFMLYSAIEKSKALDLVPRPPFGRPGAVWLLLQAVQLFWRKNRTKIYEIARTTVAYQNKSDYELARMGL